MHGPLAPHGLHVMESEAQLSPPSPALRPPWPGLLAAIWMAALAACGGGAPAPPDAGAGPRRGGTLVVAYNGDIDGVNEIAHSSTQLTTEVVSQLFLKLMDELPDYQDHPPTFVPRLAESWEWSEDHTVGTFHLRRDVRWSDGVPVTAEDVRFTWQAQVSPEVAWDNLAMKEAITDVEVVDPHTVRFHFTHAYPGQMVHLNEGHILPEHAWSRLPFSEWRRSGRWFVDHLVVSGPFTLESWQPRQQIVLRRNESYYEEGLPYLDRVVFRIVPETANQISQLLAGSLDFVRQVPASEARRIQENPELKLVSYWTPTYACIVWNLRRPQFAEAEARRALALAMDRQTIVDTLWHGYAKVADSPFISSVWAHHDGLEPWPYDPEEARRLLAELGWRDADGDGILERDGRPFTFELATNVGNQEKANAAVMIQEQLRKVGIRVQHQVLDFNTITARLLDHDFDAMMISWGLETSLDLTSFFHSRAIEEAQNFGAYSNPEVDRLLEHVRQQMDPEEQRVTFYRLQEILHREQPQTLLWESQRLTAYNRRVRDATPTPLSSFSDLRRWWLAPPDAP